MQRSTVVRVPNRERQPNALLRRARRRLGLSQEQLAELVNNEIFRATGRYGAVTAKTISDWERGWYSWPARPSRDALSVVLGAVDPAELGFRRQWPTQATRVSHRTTASRAAPLPIFALLDHQVGHFQPTADGAHGADTAAAVVEGIREAIETRRRSGRIDPARVTDLATMAALHRRSYRDIPARHLIQAAQAHLELTWSLRPDYQPEQTRGPLLTVIGEMAALLGTLLLLDQQRPRDACRYVDLAWSAAAASDNPELQAVVLGVRSFQAAHADRDHHAGLAYAEQARAIAATGASVETRGWVAAVASERAASLGDLSSCQRYLDASRAALSELSAPAPADDIDIPVLGIGEFTLDKLTAYEGGDLVRVGRYRDAEPALTAAIDNLGPYMYRHRGTALIDRAEARLAAGDVDAACDDGQAALQLVTQVQHAGNFRRLHSLAAHARTIGTGAGRDLWHQVLDLTTNPTTPAADPEGQP